MSLVPVTTALDPMFDEWAQHAAKIWMWRMARSPLIEACMQVLDRYNGDWVVPDLGVEGKPMIPTIVSDAIDHLAQRAVSTQAMTFCPALDPSDDESVARAGRRRQMLDYSLWKSDWMLHEARSYRHLFGYGVTAWCVMPNFEHKCMQVVVRNPLHAIPEPKAAEDLTPPAEVAFIYGKSAEWILRAYPEARSVIGEQRRQPTGSHVIWDIAEFCTDTHIWIGLLGPRYDFDSRPVEERVQPFPLRRWENRIGRCPAVVPERITMDKVGAAVMKVTGSADLQARLLALDIMAQEKALVPDRYALSRQGRTAVLVGGIWQDGRTGKVNVFEDTESVGELRGQVDPSARQLQDRLERNARTSTGQTPQMIGEAYGSSRSGRQIDAIMAASVDPNLQEQHLVMQARRRDANELILEGYKGYWPDKRYHVFSGLSADKGFIHFTPQEDVETSVNAVEYPLPGADLQGLTIVLGQLNAAEFISKRQARIKHPLVPNAEQAERELLLEAADEAILAMFLELARTPGSGLVPADLGEFKRQLAAGKSVEDAVSEVDRMAKERQAAVPPEPAEGEGPPVDLMSGIAMAGEGNESQPPPAPPQVQPPMPAVENLRRIASAYTGPAQ